MQVGVERKFVGADRRSRFRHCSLRFSSLSLIDWIDWIDPGKGIPVRHYIIAFASLRVHPPPYINAIRDTYLTFPESTSPESF